MSYKAVMLVDEVEGWQRETPYGEGVEYPDYMQCQLSLEPEHRRKVDKFIEHTPSEADWSEYRQTERVWDLVTDMPWIEEVSPGHFTLTPPESWTETVFAETWQEWIERCRSGGIPPKSPLAVRLEALRGNLGS